MKQSTKITVRMPDDLLRRLLYVSEREGRTPANHIMFMLRGNVSYYEKIKGRIPQRELDALDISEYIENDGE